MLCRKKIGFHERCENKVYTDGTEGYCQEHWHRYQIGLDFHDPSNDFDYEDSFFELLESLEKETFFTTNFSETKEETFKQKIEERFPDKTLEKLSKDNQNIHTTPIVKATTEIANRLMKLSEDVYFSETEVEYMLKQLKISSKARDNFKEYYYSEASIYELSKPTYKKVMNGLWIYIQTHPTNTKELLKVLKEELEDNIGTCAQGNLSRLVNVLNGFDKNYEVKQETSLNDLMLEIAKEKNLDTRLYKAKKILKDRNIKDEEYTAWMETVENY